jgi:hypothetical protein
MADPQGLDSRARRFAEWAVENPFGSQLGKYILRSRLADLGMAGHFTHLIERKSNVSG